MTRRLRALVRAAGDRIRRPLERMWLASVWGLPVSLEDQRTTGLFRYGYPWADVCLILFGVGGMFYGVPALRVAFSDQYAQVWSGTIAAVSLVCLIGVAFPTKFWRVELVAKAFLVGLLAVYGGAIMLAGFLVEPDDYGRSAVGWMPLALLGLLVWRVFDILKQRDARRKRAGAEGE